MSRELSPTSRRLIGAGAATALFLAAVLLFSCMQPPVAVTHPPSEVTTPVGTPRPARVLLVESAPTATIAASSDYTIAPGEAAPGVPAAPLDQGARLAETPVRAAGSGFSLGTRHVPGPAILVSSYADGALSVNGSRYRGQLLIRRLGVEISVLNLVPVEHYLYSVLGSESYASWPEAALDAQAIIARSYALWRMAQRRDEPFDLVATVTDQSYLGIAKENPRLSAAVDRTEGIVLLYQMKLFRCYYHSTCGGATEAVQNVFPDPPLLPLSSVPCAFCKDSPHYRWHCQISKAELADALRRGGTALSRLASLEVATRTPSGRVQDLAVDSSDGAKLAMRAGDFRLRVGPRRLPSTWFEIRDLGAAYEFRGRGWGHGVGLCQWGSKGMAEAGRSATAILQHYYPGATLQRLYRGRDYVRTEAAPAAAAAAEGAVPEVP